MPSVKRAKSWWDTVRSVSVRQIAEEARKPFALAVVGAPDRRQEVLHALFPGAPDDEVLPERSLVLAYASTREEDGFPRAYGSFDVVVDAGGGRVDPPPEAPIYSLEDLGGWPAVVARVLEQRPDLALALARRFPGFRDAVSRLIIQQTARANARFAMMSALPGALPFLAPLLPAASVGDILVVTKNQAMMLYRLAAAHDLPLDLRARSRDLAPLLANAFGWRTLAREIVGAVPGGVGMVARGAIAYAGTTAIGRGLLRLYRTGQQPTPAQVREFYTEALEDARQVAGHLAKGIAERRKAS